LSCGSRAGNNPANQRHESKSHNKKFGTFRVATDGRTANAQPTRIQASARPFNDSVLNLPLIFCPSLLRQLGGQELIRPSTFLRQCREPGALRTAFCRQKTVINPSKTFQKFLAKISKTFPKNFKKIS